VTSERASHSVLSRPFAVQSAGALAVLAGGLVLAGWTLDLAALKSLLPGWVSVKPNAALAFILTGIALWLSTVNPQFSTLSSRLARLCRWLAGVIGLLTLCEYAFGWNPGFDQWLFREPAGAVGTSHPGRMAPDTALCFMLLAAGLENACGSRKTRRTLVALAILGSLVTTVSVAAMLSYFSSALRNHGGWGLTMMAFPTAAVFAILGVALVLIAWRESTSATGRLVKPMAIPGSHAWFAFLLVFLLLSAGILATGAFSYRTYERHFRAGIEQQLSAIAELKVEQIVEWRHERLADANYARRTAYATRCALEVLAQPASQTNRQMFTDWLDALFADAHYEQALLLDERLNVGLVYPEHTADVLSEVARRAAQQALRSQQVVLDDLHRETEDGPVYLSMMVPLVARRESTGDNVPAAGKGSSPADRSVGVLVLQINAQKQLYPLIQHWPTPSRTAETLLVRRDGHDALFLNELKFQTNSALKLRASLDRTNSPAVKAALGQVGIVDGIDYRGEPVLACMRAIPDSPWSIVARMDLAEVYAPLRERLWLTVLLMGALLLGAGASVGLVWRHQRVQFYREQAEGGNEARRMATVVRDSNDAITIQDFEGQITAWNRGAELMYGYSEAEALLENIERLTAPGKIAEQKDFTRRLLAGEKVSSFETQRVTKEGRVLDVWMTVTKLMDEAGKPIGVASTERDITERKRKEQAVGKSEERYRALFNTLIDGFCIIEVLLDPEGRPADYRFLEVNPEFEAQTGLRNAQGKRMRELAPEHEEYWFELYGKVALTGEPARFVQEAKALNRWFDVSAYRVGQQDSRQVAVLFNDITERKQAEENIRLMATVVRDSNDAITIQDFAGRITAWNHGAELMYGYSETEALVANIDLLTIPDKVQEQKDFTRRLVAGEKVTSFETQRVTKDGRILDVWMTVTKLVDEAGKPIGVASTERDISVRKREAEEASRMATVVRDSNDAITIQDFQGRITAWNRGAELMYGYSEAEALVANIDRLTAPGKVAEQKDFIRRLEAGEAVTSLETQRVTKDGRILDVWMTVTKLVDEAGKPIGIASTERDISVRKRAAEKLQQQTDELRARNEELMRFNRAVVGRELQMVKLKQQINELCREMGKPLMHRLDFLNAESPASMAAETARPKGESET
jgi:PAS domain S-box-containing protein